MDMNMDIRKSHGKILIVDDEASVRRLLVSVFKRNGYETVEAAGGLDAVTQVESQEYDLVLLDIKMPDMDGMTALEKIKSISPDTPVVMITGYGSVESAVKALTLGAFYYITKPFENFEELLDIVESAMDENRRRKEVFSNPRNRFLSTAILSEISYDLNSTLEFKKLTEIFFRKAGKLFDFDYIGLFVSAADADGNGVPENIIIEKGKGFNDYETEYVKRFLLSKYAAFNFRTGISDAPEPIPWNIASDITLPLVYENNVLGVVGLGSFERKKYSVEDSRLLAILANQFSSSLHNCILFEKMKKLAMKDSLTDLYNFRFFRQMMEHELDRADRYGHSLSFIIMDIDGFKKINDIYGHAAGDSILSETAAVVLRAVRKSDILARYGGDEFVVICPETDGGEAAVLAERIRKEVECHDFTSIHPDTASTGRRANS